MGKAKLGISFRYYQSELEDKNLTNVKTDIQNKLFLDDLQLPKALMFSVTNSSYMVCWVTKLLIVNQ